MKKILRIRQIRLIRPTCLAGRRVGQIRFLRLSKKGRAILFALSILILLNLSFLLGYRLLSTKNASFAAPWAQSMSNWNKRKQITLVNNSGATLHATVTYKITINTKELFDAGFIQSDCDDLRVVYQPDESTAKELKRNFEYPAGESCSTSTTTQVAFPLEADLSNSSNSSNYYFYYYYSDAPAYPIADALDAYNIGAKEAIFVAPFNGASTALSAGSGTPTTETGAVRYSGTKSALSFDGLNDHVSITSGENMLSDAFTWEGWIYWNQSGAAYQSPFSNGASNDYKGQVFITTSTGTIRATLYNVGNSISTNTITPRTWTHVAVTYDIGGDQKLHIYLNGTEVTYSTQTVYTGSLTSHNNFTVGDSTNSLHTFNGLIDEVRVSNNVRYSGNFTPQTAPFIRDENTKLLLHLDENGDDPRNTGKTIDDSGNNNHGTITGAKYVGGLVGVDGSSNSTNLSNLSNSSFASHNGIFIEEGTTNKITNPSFENATYDTNWTSGGNSFETFTPGNQSLSKRIAPGPFTAAPIIQGDPTNTDSLTDDILSISREKQIGGNFYSNFDTTQGSVVLWWTPEYSYNAQSGSGLHYLWYVNANYYLAYDYANDRYQLGIGGQSMTVSSNIVGGTAYGLTARWDTKSIIQGSNYAGLSIDDSTTFGITTQPTVSAPATTIYIGSNGTTGSSSGIIEGLTVYRRVLYDGTNGINANAGADEVAVVKTTGGSDPTLITGSWDIVFAMPTNSTVGALTSGIGNAWSHPHTSNLLPGNSNTGGFMLNGTYGTDGWVDEGSPTAVAALAESEKIYTGGYKVTSDAANEGIYDEIAVTSGQDFVVRAVAHSDGTSIPKIVITGADDAAITSMTGTTTSTRTAPDVFVFTFEADATENIKVKLINSDATAAHITYWHQVEVLSSTVNNPSMERVTGTPNPWIPDDWQNYSAQLDSGDTSEETTTKHSGSRAIKFNSGATSAELLFSLTTFSSVNGSFNMLGGFTYGNGSTGVMLASTGTTAEQLQAGSGGSLTRTSAASWTHKTGIWWKNPANANTQGQYTGNSASDLLLDDVYAFRLSDSYITVIPASQTNSTETSGLRVDGRDTAIQQISSLNTGSGTIKFKYTPRHSAADVLKFYEATDTYIAEFVGSATDYIRLYWSAANTITMAYSMDGTTGSSTWAATGAIVAGTTYDFQIDYTGSSTMVLTVGGTARITLSSIPANFGTAPYLAFWGSRKEGDRQGDATFAAATSGSTFNATSLVFVPTVPLIAKRNGANTGPFTAGVTIQGDPTNTNSLTDDVLSFNREKQIGGNFYSNMDTDQGSVVLWWTPEYSYNSLSGAGLHYIWYLNSNYYLAYDYANDRFEQKIGSQTITSSSNVSAGTAYNLIAYWDTKNVLSGSNYQCLTIDDGTPTCGTTQPTASAPAASIYIGSNGTTGGSSGIIEGLTVYRRPLYDGTNGINVGNGDEINLINDGGTHTGANNAAALTDSTKAWTTSTLIGGTVKNNTDGSSCTITANTTTTVTCTLSGGTEHDWDTGDNYTIVSRGGKDPTYVTGSWDVVFDLPTNSTVGSIVTSTGEAWSHPHSSNLLAGTNGAAGFMLNGTYTNDGFTAEGTPTAVAALSTSEKIFAGGYKTTSDAANEGIYKDITVTAGQDFVIRGLANSDGTSVPKIVLYDQTNGTEIGSLTGATSSTRAAPNVLVFTGEAPDGKAIGTIMLTGLPANDQTVTIDSRVYTYKTSLTGTPDTGATWVLIGAAYTNAADNLRRAIINSGGTTYYKYGTGVSTNTVVTASVSYGNVTLTALSAGTGGNVALSETADNTTVSGANLTGGQTACTTARIKLINTASSGTTYWHQVEVLNNLISNPSMETGTGNPWLPVGWGNYAYDLGELIQSTGDLHSGSSALQIYGTAQSGNWNSAYYDFTDIAGNFYGAGLWGKYISDTALVRSGVAEGNAGTIRIGVYPAASNTSWTHLSKTGVIPSAVTEFYLGLQSGNYNSIVDDIYTYSLNNTLLTVTPASSTNSIESDKLRVDGLDTYTNTLTTPTTTSGTITFDYTPRHSAADIAKFGETTPYVAKFMSNATDYIALYWSAANTLKLEYQMNGGTVTSTTWNATGAIVAGTTYQMVVAYTGSGDMTLSVDGVNKITLSSIPAAFANPPTIAYWGSNSDGTKQNDATFAAGSVTATENTTAPYYKFTAKSAKLVNANSEGKGLVTAINAGNTNTHTLTAYVYDGTTGNIGGTVSSSIAKLVFNGIVVTPSAYTDMGGGWWRLSYSGATLNAATTYGVSVLPSKTVYVDGVQLEEKTYATTYADGSLGTGYGWDTNCDGTADGGTANNSCSARTTENLQYSSSSNLSAATGSYSFWLKSQETIGSISGDQYLFDIRTDASNRISVFMDSSEDDLTLNTNGTETSSTDTTVETNAWVHLVLTWDFTNDQYKLYRNGNSTPIITTTTSLTAPSLPTNFVVGGDYNNANKFNGALSETRIYSSVLTATEVADLYNAGLGSHSEQTVASDQFTDGEPPVLAWHFDEGYDTIAHDSSIYQNNGTISGSNWSNSTNLSNSSNFSQSFDGTNDYISRTYSSDTELNPNTNPFSVSAWFKTSSSPPASQLTLLSRYNTAGYKVYMNTSGQMCFAIDFDSTWTPADLACSTASFADSQWHHVEAIKSDTSITLYIDGSLVGTDDTLSAATSLSGNSPTFYVGIDSDGTSNPWNGLIDEVRVYNSQRSEDQIKQEVIDNGGSLEGSSVRLGGQGYAENLSQGLVGYWKMDESSGNAADSSGNGNTLTNNHSTAFASGKFSNSAQADGANDYFSTASTIADVQTISFWAYPSSTTDNFVNVSNSPTINITASSGTVAATGFTSPSVYINGVLNGTVTASVWNLITITSDTTVSATNFEIARAGGNYYSNTSKIDEIRVYNRVLSPAEIRALYEWAPGPNAYWKLDENTGTVANDSSENNFTGTLTAGPTWAAGMFGSAVSFDGSDDFVDVGTGPTAVNTVEFWANPSTTTEYLVDLNGSAYIRANAGTITATGFTSPTIYVNGKVSSTITANAWSHVTVTTATSLDASDLDIGRLEGTDYLTGKLDDVRLYDYVRTQKQITSDMNAGHPSVGSPVGSAVGYWKFDEGYSTTINNSGSVGLTINGNMGVGSSAPTWTNNGKFGKALSFDGNDYVSIADNTAFDIDQNGFTYSAWINGNNFSNQTYNMIMGHYLPYFNVRSTGVLHLSMYAGGAQRSVIGLISLSVGRWYHVAATYDSQGYMKVYVNGKLDNTAGPYLTPGNYNYNQYIGTWYSGLNYPFNGLIDETKVYNYALSEDEIKTEYNRGAALSFGSLSDTSNLTGGSVASNSATAAKCVPGSSDACSSPVAEWNFDENTGITANDISENNFTGTLTAGPTWTTGKIGPGINFDGADDFIDIGTGPSSVKTVEFWVNPTTTTEYPIDINGTAYVWFNGGTVTAQGFTSPSIYVNGVSTTAISAGSWQHVTVTTDTALNASDFDIGRIEGVGNFEGKIDHIELFDYVRARAQISWDYSRGAPVVHYKMDECTGSTLHSSNDTYNPSLDATIYPVSNDNTSVGTCGSGTATEMWNDGTAGKFNGSLGFDGNDDYTGVSGSISTNSVAFWVKPTSNTASMINLASGVYITSSSGTITATGFTTPTYYVNGAATTTPTLTANQWNHIAVTTTTAITANAITFGKANGAYTTGQIDDVRIYNYALTPAQIKEIQNGGTVRF